MNIFRRMPIIPSIAVGRRHACVQTADELAEARESGRLLEPGEVADVVTFMLTRPRGMTIRDVVLLPTHFDL